MRNPYPGPRAFRTEEYGIFAGRDHEISELTSLIISHQVVLLYAQSGAGKSSLVNAGLANSLSEREIRLLPVARVGVPVPIEVPLDQVANVFVFSMACDILPEIAVSDPWRRSATLVDAFNRLPELLDDSGERVLSVCAIDQFEELFSVYPERWPDREKFFLEISALLDARRDVRILFVLREDSLAAFSHLAAVLPEGGRTRYRIERLREDEAIAAIRKPLQGTACSFAPDVAETVVRDLMNITVASPGREAVDVRGEFVEPVQLQVVCYRLFDNLPETTTSVTLETYRRFGNPDDALEGFYRQALDAATASTGVDEGELRDWFERKLITPAGTRGLVFQDHQSTGDMPNRVVEVLEQRHVIRPEIRSGFRWYELTHDRFIRPIQRSNLAWKSARWSPSFDARYTATIQAAAGRTGIAEKTLRDFLDSLSDADGTSHPRPAQRVPEEALAELVDAGLLRRVSAGGRVLYSRPQLTSPGWRIRAATRGARAANIASPGLPSEFLTTDSRVAEEVMLDPTPTTRGQLTSGAMLDLSCDVEPGEAAILAIRHPSGALTFHVPVQSRSRGGSRAVASGIPGSRPPKHDTRPRQRSGQGDRRESRPVGGRQAREPGPAEARRGVRETLVAEAWAQGRLAAGHEGHARRRGARGRHAGVTGALAPLHPRPVLERRVHLSLAGHLEFLRARERRLRRPYLRVRPLQPHPNARRKRAHAARGPAGADDDLRRRSPTREVAWCCARSWNARASSGPSARRFKLGRAVLVASPNEGTPLATPERWDETIGWLANLLELFPDNPFTTGAAFVANGLVWLANHASGDIPGLHAMDERGRSDRGDPGSTRSTRRRVLRVGGQLPADRRRCCSVCWTSASISCSGLPTTSSSRPRADGASIARAPTFIPASRIGCFGPGGNLRGRFSHPRQLLFARRNRGLSRQRAARPPAAAEASWIREESARSPAAAVRTRNDGRGVRPKGGGSCRSRAAGPKHPTQSRCGWSQGAQTFESEALPAYEEEPLRITVTNGDLTFEREALLLGHYRSTRLTGTEGVMDRLIGGAMGHSLEVGNYPFLIGSHQIFINARPNLERGSFLPRPKAVIVVGLGEEGKLQAAGLAHTVRQAVIGWAQRLAENSKHAPAFFELATTLIGSGGTGVTPGEAACLIAQGVHDANVLLKDEHRRDGKWPRVSHLHFIELYLDRATEAWRSLRMQEAATPGRYGIDDAVAVGTGPLQRPPDSGYRGADYDFITVETKQARQTASR